MLKITSEVTTPKIKRVQFDRIDYYSLKAIPCFLKELEFLRKNKTYVKRNFGHNLKRRMVDF